MKNDSASEIRAAIDERYDALRAKDVDRLMACFADEPVLFDVRPPSRFAGADAVRAFFLERLACFPDDFGVEIRDLDIAAGGTHATAMWLYTFTGLPSEYPVLTMRASAGYVKESGVWKIIHSHISLPMTAA